MAWTRLNRLKEAYREERAGIVSYPKGADLSDLTLSEADLEAVLME